MLELDRRVADMKQLILSHMDYMEGHLDNGEGVPRESIEDWVQGCMEDALNELEGDNILVYREQDGQDTWLKTYR